jgi:hypothetical protein
MSRATPAGYEEITSILMTYICTRRRANIIANGREEVELDEIINKYGAYGEKIDVKEVILEYGADSSFYQVHDKSIVLTESGRSECERLNAAPE